MNEGNNPLEKVKKMLLLLIKKQKRIKYREYVKKIKIIQLILGSLCK